MRHCTAKIVLLLTAMPVMVCAQRNSFRLHGSADGLKNLAVLALAQDGAGYLGVGTEAGLYRYDGTQFRPADGAVGMPCTSEVQTRFVARDGALWANTCSRLFRHNGWQFEAAAGIDEMLSRSQAIAEGPGGNLLVATGSGLKEVVLANGTYTARAYWGTFPLAKRDVAGLFSQGTEVWFGCKLHLCRLTGGHPTEMGPPSALARGLDRTVWAEMRCVGWEIPRMVPFGPSSDREDWPASSPGPAGWR